MLYGIDAMDSNRLSRAPISCPARNPATKSWGVPKAARSGTYVDRVAPKSDRQLGRVALDPCLIYDTH